MKERIFHVGDVVIAKININFMYGEKHTSGESYEVTEETVSYFNVNQNDYFRKGLSNEAD